MRNSLVVWGPGSDGKWTRSGVYSLEGLLTNNLGWTDCNHYLQRRNELAFLPYPLLKALVLTSRKETT